MLDKKYSIEIERKWQKEWEEKEAFKFNRDFSKPLYVIDTPPPFTSGKLHMGHVLSYSYFDFDARYRRMKGYNVLYPQGWDAQGFPTEVKVEKKYGKLNREEFRNKCIEWSNEMIKNMKRQMKLLGFSPDWNLEYITMTKEYHKLVQLSVIEMYKKGHIYREKHPVLWCASCHSAIAKAETEEKEEKTNLAYFKFYGEGKDIVIASTRPELLHACVAVVVNEEDERYKDLIGKEVKTPFGRKVKVFGDKEVDKEFGTGAVMVCTYGDKQDLVWQKRYSLELIEGIDKRGRIINSKLYDGLKVKEARKKVIELLKEGNHLVKIEEINHNVKIHDRCKKEVELLPSYEWFAAVRRYAEKIREMAKEVEWIPSHGISHIMNWLDSIDWDWVISRNRIFGTPIPFYVCENENCDYVEEVDKEELPFYPEHAKNKVCKKCNSKLIPETKVFDVWIDSSITPLVISGWERDEELFKHAYPTSLRPQGVEIVRTWAFYTLYRSGVALTGKKPWEKVLLNGNVLAPDGRKMSKSLGNIIDPEQLLNEYPADAIRQWAAMSGAMAKDRPFSYEDIKYARQFLNKLWNAARFVENSLKGYNPTEGVELRVVDRWILSRVSFLGEELEKHMENYEFRDYIIKLQNFVWKEFCDYYLEYVKYRIYEKEDKAAKYTLYKVMEHITKLLSPISPHISEEIYSNVLGKESFVSLSEWPSPLLKDEKAIEEFKTANEVMRAIRNYKSRNQLSQKEELSKVVIYSPQKLKESLEEIKKTGKIKEIEVIDEKELRIEIIR